MVEELSQRHLIVEGGRALEGEDPGFLDHPDDEVAPVALGGPDDALELELGRPFALGFDTDGLRCVDVDGRIVRGQGSVEGVEGVAVGGEVVRGVVDEPRKIADPSRDIDGLEGVREVLAEVFDVIVGWLADDGRERCCEIGEQRFDVVDGGRVDGGGVERG